MRLPRRMGAFLPVAGMLCLLLSQVVLAETAQANTEPPQQAKHESETGGESVAKPDEAKSEAEMAARIDELETRLQALGGDNGGARFSSSKLHVAGLGGWGYNRTDGNNYMLGSKEGEYDYHMFALTLSAHPSDRLQVKMQIFNGSEPGEEAEDPFAVGLDYVFARWDFNDNVAFVAGQVKHPFGVYTEILDVGTLRPFMLLPQSIYGRTGMAAESFMGAGLVFSAYSDAGWEWHLDVYGGEIPLEITVRHSEMEPDTTGMGMGEMEEMEEMEGEIQVRDAVGGRLALVTPVEGLGFGISGYTGEIESDGERFEAYGAQIEYLARGISFRSEVGRHTRGEMTMTGYYVETAYRFGMSPWQVAARFDHADHEMAESELEARFSENDEAAFGVNFWVNDNFVIKSAYHEVRGNMFTSPQEGEEETRETSALSMSIAFAF